jgi:hypothetical protein
VGWDYHVHGALVAEPNRWISASLGAVQSFAGRAPLATVRREARAGLSSGGECTDCGAAEWVSRSSVGPRPGVILQCVEDITAQVSTDVSQAV